MEVIANKNTRLVLLMCDKNLFIYELPYVERKELCMILDENDKWLELASRHMGYNSGTIQVTVFLFRFYK